MHFREFIVTANQLTIDENLRESIELTKVIELLERGIIVDALNGVRN